MGKRCTWFVLFLAAVFLPTTSLAFSTREVNTSHTLSGKVCVDYDPIQRVECCAGYHPIDNICVACPEGSYGKNCSEICPLGYYGLLCGQTCDCSSDEKCDASKGCITIGRIHLKCKTGNNCSDGERNTDLLNRTNNVPELQNFQTRSWSVSPAIIIAASASAILLLSLTSLGIYYTMRKITEEKHKPKYSVEYRNRQVPHESETYITQFTGGPDDPYCEIRESKIMPKTNVDLMSFTRLKKTKTNLGNEKQKIAIAGSEYTRCETKDDEYNILCLRGEPVPSSSEYATAVQGGAPNINENRTENETFDRIQHAIET